MEVIKNKQGDIIYQCKFIEPNIIFVELVLYRVGDAIELFKHIHACLEKHINDHETYYFIRKFPKDFFKETVMTSADVEGVDEMVNAIKNRWQLEMAIDVLNKNYFGYDIFQEVVKKGLIEGVECVVVNSYEEAIKLIEDHEFHKS